MLRFWLWGRWPKYTISILRLNRKKQQQQQQTNKNKVNIHPINRHLVSDSWLFVSVNAALALHHEKTVFETGELYMWEVEHKSIVTMKEGTSYSRRRWCNNSLSVLPKLLIFLLLHSVGTYFTFVKKYTVRFKYSSTDYIFLGFPSWEISCLVPRWYI